MRCSGVKSRGKHAARESRSMKHKTQVMLIPTLLLLAIVSSCATYSALPYTPQPVSSLVTVTETSDYLLVKPQGSQAGNSSRGILFYPGALVAPGAYIPLAELLAAETQSVTIIVTMPFDLAVLAPAKALRVMKEFPEITEWYIGGHSLGGAMAARLTYDNPDTFTGLLLFAAYPAKSNNLSASEIPVLSISAEYDGLATTEKIQASRSLLPEAAVFVEVSGGNHAGFGNYGVQKGDGAASITPEVQWELTSQAVKEFFDSL